MAERIIALVLTAVIAVYCQSTPPPTIPDWVLYIGLFKRVCYQEQFGDRLDAKGENSSFVRAHIRKAAGLTDDEDAALKRIAKEWDAGNRAYYAQSTQLMARQRAIVASGQPPDPNISAQLRQLNIQENANIVDHMAQIRAVMGLRVQVLDNYIRTAIQPTMAYKAGSPSKGKP